MSALTNLGIGEHVLSVGRHLRHRLTAMDDVVEVRGHGLMRGAELDAPVAARVVEEGLAEGRRSTTSATPSCASSRRS